MSLIQDRSEHTHEALNPLIKIDRLRINALTKKDINQNDLGKKSHKNHLNTPKQHGIEHPHRGKDRMHRGPL